MLKNSSQNAAPKRVKLDWGCSLLCRSCGPVQWSTRYDPGGTTEIPADVLGSRPMARPAAKIRGATLENHRNGESSAETGAVASPSSSSETPLFGRVESRLIDGPDDNLSYVDAAHPGDDMFVAPWRRYREFLPFVVIAVAFAAVRLVAIWGRSPLVYPDSATYRPPPGGLSYPLVSFMGNAPRSWVVPFFYRLLGSDELRVRGQAVASIGAWIALATSAASVVHHRWLKNGAFIAVLLLAWSPHVAFWDLTLLAESFSISLSVAALACWLRFATRPSWAAALGAVGFSGLWVLTRPFQYPIAVALAGTCLLWAWRGEKRAMKTTAAVALLMVAAWSIASSARVAESYRHRDGYGVSYFAEAFGQNFYHRYLPDPAAAAWFTRRGMPSSVGLGEPEAPSSPDKSDYTGWVAYYARMRDRPDWLRWLDKDAQTLVLRYTVTHPLKVFGDFGDAAPYLLRSATNPTSYYGAPVDPLPDPLDRIFFWGSRSSPWADWALWVLAVLSLGITSTVRRARPDRRLLTVGVLTTVGSLGLIFEGWLGSAYEMVRHALSGAVLVRVGLLLLAACLLDALLRAKSDPSTDRMASRA